MKYFPLLVLVALLFAATPADAQKHKRSRKADTTVAINRFHEVWQLIGERYVESPDLNSLSEEAIKAMLNKLDPHSLYIAARDVQRANENLQGNFEGVGISFQILSDTIVIVDIIKGGPSEKTGLSKGDKITAIDGKPAVGDSVNNTFVSNHLRGEKGSTVNITVLHLNGTSETFAVVRDRVPIRSVENYFMVNDTIGYISLSRFARTSASEVHQAIDVLRRQGMKALLLDLRGNTGGYLDIATSLANEFLPANNLIVYTEGRAQKRQNFKTNGRGSFRSGKLVVMIDENSASASEILSGCIQDHDRGTIVGRRSFGKGLVQKVFNLKDGSQVRLTTARYYTPSGRCIQKPYDKGSDAYRNDISQRYSHGELVSADSIHIDSTLVYHTDKGRAVYGGGGIVPDRFVPMDTTHLTDYYLQLRKKGVISDFPLIWVNKHRHEFSNTTFEDFLARYDSYNLDAAMEEYAKSKEIEHDMEKEAAEPQRTAHTAAYQHEILKAQVAKFLYGSEYYYRVMRHVDNTYKAALEEFSK